MALTAETVRSWYIGMSDAEIADKLTEELGHLTYWKGRTEAVIASTRSTSRKAKEGMNLRRLETEIAAWEQRLALLRETACTE